VRDAADECEFVWDAGDAPPEFAGEVAEGVEEEVVGVDGELVGEGLLLLCFSGSFWGV